MNLTNSAGIRETVGDAGYPWKHGSLTPRTWGRISPNDYVHNRVLGMDTCEEDRQGQSSVFNDSQPEFDARFRKDS
jgi:hypothetical protein